MGNHGKEIWRRWRLNKTAANGHGEIILVKTINPNSGDYQDLNTGNPSLAQAIDGLTEVLARRG